jgi:N-methylhydantoinase B
MVPVGDGETYMIPVEVCEARYPIQVEQYTFNTAQAGAGEYRGGCGLIRDYRLLAQQALLTTTFGRHRFPPWGAHGGGAGSTNGVRIIPAGNNEPILSRGKLARYPLRYEDVVRLVTA